ncbi:MAG: polysaccharide biosynthesis C-terminal domain-containing protein, partial [Candidatus Omnitrophica bacterium]|nr:polysaccharide biosynthesis C-terminal domain-containing protein [Candidatus Omnitrophota bacterium]
VSRILERVLNLGLVYAVSVYGRLDIMALMGILGVNGLIQFVILFFLTKKYLNFLFEPSLVKVTALLKGGLPFFLSNIFMLIYLRTDVALLGWLSSDKNVGIYSAANQIYQMGIFSMILINVVIFPPLMVLYQRGTREFVAAVDDLVRFVIAYAMGLSMGLFVLADKIIRFIFHGQLLESIWVLKGYAVILFFSLWMPLFQTLLIANNRQRLWSEIMGLTVLFNGFANYILIWVFSYFGAIYATGASSGFCWILSIFLLKKYMSIKIQLLSVVKSLVAGMVMFSVLYCLRDGSLFLLTCVGILVYGMGLIGLQYFSRDDYDFFKGLIFRKMSSQ